MSTDRRRSNPVERRPGAITVGGDGRRLRTNAATAFLLGFVAGMAMLLLLRDVGGATSSSSSSPGVDAEGVRLGVRRGLISVTDFVDPATVAYKDVAVEGGGAEGWVEQQQGDLEIQSLLEQQRQHQEELESLLQQQQIFVDEQEQQQELPHNFPEQQQAQQQQSARHVHVGSMCRCPSGQMPVPGAPIPEDEFRTEVVQPPSLATGPLAKSFVMHRTEGVCACVPNGGRSQNGEVTTDLFLKRMGMEPNKKMTCERLYMDESRYEWDGMPDFGVEEGLPLFVGVLSYESSESLNGTLHNWLDHDLFRRINARDAFVQLNHRSDADDHVMLGFLREMDRQQKQSPMTFLGLPNENLNPGLAIANFCRRAESHPDGHPNGENILLFLEKDWRLYNNERDVPSDGDALERLFRGINGLVQRGVPYVHLKRKSNEVSNAWPCPSQGFPFECTRARQHRWTNQPLAVRCDWFLRYLEPFALLNDPIMYGCRRGMQEAQYVDWEFALQDGRVAWSEAQWVSAHLMTGNHRLFFHEEVDQ